MFVLLPIVVALAAAEPVPASSTAPAPAASAAPAAGGTKPTPLTEIGRVRALPACVPIVAHANQAITTALDNDRTLAVITTNLHGTNYDKLNWLQRRNALDALLKQAEAVRLNYKAANGEIKKLREYAAASNDAERQKELKTFADALGGALNRQQKAAAEVMRDIEIMRGREDVEEAKGLRMTAPIPQNVIATAQVPLSAAPTPQPAADFYTRQMVQMGNTIDDMLKGVQWDEGIAADHSIAATSGC